LLDRADVMLRTRLADARQRGAFTVPSLVDDMMHIVSEGSGSVLLLGEAGSGKTHAVESCLSKLQEEQGDNLVVLRAYGGAYSTDVECIRHLAAQMRGGDQAMPPRNASFELGMEFIRGVLRESLGRAKQIVVVLEKFEAFCSKSRQTLLYNLFDIAEEVGVRLSIIGTSEKIDVTSSDSLEKRIKSRFSMHHLHMYLPRTVDQLIPILLEKFRLDDDWDFPPAFVKQFHMDLQTALKLRARSWEAHLEVGRPPAWFLWQCLPVVDLVLEAKAGGGNAKPSFVATTRGVQRLLVDSLCEDEHVVLLALLRLQQRQASPTLSLILYEIGILHGEGGGKRQMLTTTNNQDRYSGAFDRLLQAKLVDIAGSPGSTMVSVGAALPRLHRSCQSRVNNIYEEFVKDLKNENKSYSKDVSNPLARLPEVIQQWVR
jgi:hypothetical protein